MDHLAAPSKPRITRVAAYAVIVDEGRLLLCRLSHVEYHSGKWTLPGGGIEFGEHPEAAAIREVFEETGLHVELSKLLTVESYHSETPSSTLHGIQIIYQAKVIGGQIRAEKDGTTDSCDWIPIQQVASLPMVPLARIGLRLAEDLLG